MKKLRILHLEDRSSDAELVQQSLAMSGIDADFAVVDSEPAFRDAVDHLPPDLILLDNGVPSFSGAAALDIARRQLPQTPVLFVTGAVDPKRAEVCLRNGASGVVAKGDTNRLAEAVREVISHPATPRVAKSTPSAPPTAKAPALPPGDPRERHFRGMERLVVAVQDLSRARTLEEIQVIVRTAARELTGADGATFVLRDNDKCHYADEDAISPLWKGKRFPLNLCISGWAMLNKKHVVIPDIYVDSRIPIDAYRPTFVKSLVMVPIRTEQPIGAIGNYWAKPHVATPEEISLLQALANTTSVALENVRLIEGLEQRVKDRTQQLEVANLELEAFSYSVSHDLQSPLGIVISYIQLLEGTAAGKLDTKEKRFLHHIQTEAWRMSELIRDLLRLAQVARAELNRGSVDLSALAAMEASRLRDTAPERQVEFVIQPGVVAEGDEGLLRVVLENLMGNAWKYSAKREHSVIEFGSLQPPDRPRLYFVKDNGAGFDMRYVDKLFAPFQRLHRKEDFAGTGVGLATVGRIIHKHSGRIRAEGIPDVGATFYFTLG